RRVGSPPLSMTTAHALAARPSRLAGEVKSPSVRWQSFWVEDCTYRRKEGVGGCRGRSDRRAQACRLIGMSSGLLTACLYLADTQLRTSFQKPLCRTAPTQDCSDPCERRLPKLQ